MAKLVILWALAALFTANSVLVTLRSSVTFGTVFMWCVSAIFIVYALFYKQIDAFCRHGFGRVLKYCFFAGVLVFIGLFVFVAVSGYRNTAKGDEKAIIILGAGLQGEEVSDVLARRLQTGLEAWQQNPEAVIVVTGGQGRQEPLPEAVAMQRWLLARGVPEDSIIVEDKSTSTEENLAFSMGLLAERGITTEEPVLVVTNSFHCYRAGRYAEMTGFADVRLAPASMNPIQALPSYAREVFAILFLWIFKR